MIIMECCNIVMKTTEIGITQTNGNDKTVETQRSMEG